MSSRANGRVATSMVPLLRSRLSSRLADLEAECQLLRRAIAALDEPSRQVEPAGVKRNRHGTAEMVMRALKTSPGSRASMIALTTQVEMSDVTAALQSLEAAGDVRRDGLGWSLSTR